VRYVTLTMPNVQPGELLEAIDAMQAAIAKLNPSLASVGLTYTAPRDPDEHGAWAVNGEVQLDGPHITVPPQPRAVSVFEDQRVRRAHAALLRLYYLAHAHADIADEGDDRFALIRESLAESRDALALRLTRAGVTVGDVLDRGLEVLEP
jgi:hypothetical protein